MIEIRPLASFDPAIPHLIASGYSSPARYRVTKTESTELTIFSLELVQLETPYDKSYDPQDDETLALYHTVAQNGLSLGVYDGSALVGIALAEHRTWNNTLWVWEFHIAEAYRGQGIGTRLMETLAQRSRDAGMRAIVCETQNTNVPAIRFYRKLGFTLDGIDLSLYSSDDDPDGEIALFMARKL